MMIKSTDHTMSVILLVPTFLGKDFLIIPVILYDFKI